MRVMDPMSGTVLAEAAVTADPWNAQLGFRANVDTTSAAATVNAPTPDPEPPSQGGRRVFAVTDSGGDASTHNITIDGGAYNINGAATLVIADDGATVVLVFDGTEWRKCCWSRAINFAGQPGYIDEEDFETGWNP